MRIAISNIAWDVVEDEAVAAVLRRHGIDAIDLAPSKYFADFQSAAAADMLRVRGWWADRGIELTGMQSLLYGTQGLNLFGQAEVQAAMLRHLEAVCRIGQGLGATRLVFGSPKNRDRSGLDDGQAMHEAVSFFRKLGDVAARHGVLVCLEPNPPRYGANFMTTGAETAVVVRAVDHPAIKLQFDTGAFAITGEDPGGFLEKHAALVGHIHASEPGLLPLGDGDCDHARMAAAARSYLPQHPVTIEMLATADEPHATAIERAVQAAVRYYR